MILFQAEDISVRFRWHPAVDSVSFDVREGEVFSIIGPNGAGKTTIFNLISRIYTPTSGKLILEDQEFTHTPPIASPGWGSPARSRISSFSRMRRCYRTFLSAVTVTQRSASCRNWRSCPRSRERTGAPGKVEDVIAFLGLQRYRGELIANLPYGVRKVVELGRALCIEPSCCCWMSRRPA